MNIRSFFNRFMPPACLLCGGPAHAALCTGCRDDLPWHREPACPVCAHPSPGGRVCGACLKHPPAYDRTRAALVYAFPLDRLIPQLKYHGRLAVAPALADCLAAHLGAAPPPDCLVPMPLHPGRLRERGFNQAGEIARGLAQRLDLRLATEMCRRVRDTPPQMRLAHDQRRRNVRDAFACDASVRGLHIAVVDDVMTTGSSLDALARSLKRAGAREVSCWVAARALPAPSTQAACA
ncbi:MAG: ComF family protein [Thiobacillus sp.]|nr:ComF family protein [Thiobacillus sp.]